MKKTLLLFSLLCCLLAGTVKAQMDYTVSYPTSTFTALTGGTAPTLTLAYPADLAASQGVTTSDEGAANNVTLPFTFKFNGVDYTKCHISTNGFLSFGTALGQITAYSTNSLTSGPYTSATNDGRASRPLIAPLWDDLAGPATGYITYQTSGTAPNRVFTVQWLNAKWDWEATSASISFQAKLYETTNVIDFVYRRETGSPSLGATASIGLANVTTGSTDFLSLNGVTSATTPSFRSEGSVGSRPATNFTIRFTPTPTPAVDAALKQLVSIPLASCYNTPQSVTYTIVNRGTTPIAPGAATLSVVLTGANTGTYQVANTRTLAIYQTEDLTISTLNLNNVGSTTVTATVALASDSRSSNDALTNSTNTTPTRSSFPVQETFAGSSFEFGLSATLAGSQTLWSLRNSASFAVANNTTPITPIAGATDNFFLLFMANNVIGNGNGFRSVIYSNCIELPSGGGQRNISFYMTRDGYTNPDPAYTSADSLYVVYSEDKAQTWTRLQGFGRLEAGIPFTWRRYEVNLNSLAGKTVHLGFEGVSKGGNAFALDSITVNATVTCTNPTAQTVTGGGSYCAGGTGVAIGLANSETGVTYQLKRGTTDISTQSGTTGQPISFGNQTTAGTYTVVATGTTGGCTATMSNSVSVTVNDLPGITLGTINSVSTGATNFSLPYSAVTGSPNQYSISAGTPTAMPSFAAVSNATLVASPIAVTIPAGAANTYNFNLTVRNSTTGCVSATVPFTLTVAAPTPTTPTITSFSPLSAKPGDAVTITGTGFNTTAANNIVFFGATRATVTAATATSMTATVPTGATYAPISVLNTATVLSAASRANFNPIYAPAKTALTTADFLAKVDFTTGSSPRSVAIGDLDGDGKPDLVTANSGTGANSVSVFRNTGTTTTPVSFAAKADFTTGNGPYSVAIGDLDGDGKPDLAVANNTSNSVSVFRNTSTSGSISFAAKTDFATGNGPRSVTIGDLDGDGKPDLATANTSANSVSVLRNTTTSGSITTSSFAPKTDFTTGTEPTSVVIGDLDGDDKPDLATANQTGTVSVLRNTTTSGSITTSSFAAKVDFTTGSSPQSLAIGDLDGDGKPELVTANYSSDNVSVLRNTGTGTTPVSFADKTDITTGDGPYSVAIGDLDGDGKPDLATANLNTSNVSVLRNTGTTPVSFAAKTDFTTGTGSASVAIGDLNDDSKPDLVTANFNANRVSVLRNAGVITVTGTLMPFQTCSGVPSNEQSFTVSGSNLTGDITVSVSSGVQVSQTSGGSYGSSVTLTPINGSVGSTPIFVRLPATTVPSGGTSGVSGVINVTSPGATSRTVSFSGSVVPFPSITLGTISSVSTTATSFSIPYSALTSADQYSITTGTPTAMPNFSAVTNGDFPEGNFINVPIPAGAANTYNFNLTVRSSTTGCVSDNLPFTLTVTAPTLTTLTLGTATNPTNCTGTPNGSIAFTSTGYTAGNQTLNYEKDNVAATPATVTIAADGSFTLTGLGAGVYSDFAIGSTAATGTRQLVPQTTLPQFTVRSNSPQCERSGLSLESTVTNAAFNTTFTYAWTGPNGFTAATANATISSLLPVNAGTYNLLVTNTQTGCSDTKSLTVVVFPLPAIPTITASSMQLCKGESVLLTGTCSATTDIFRWTTPPLLGNSVASLSNINQRTITTPGVYKGLCESKDGCTSSEVSIDITERSDCSGLNFITVTPSKTAICPGGSVQLTASGCTGGTLTWIGGATPQTGASITVSPTISTQYFVQCSTGGSGSVIVVVAQPTVAVSNNIITGQDYIKATQTITSDKKIGDATFTPAPSVLYEAGSSITLLPGFVAEKWSTFKAEIKGCN